MNNSDHELLRVPESIQQAIERQNKWRKRIFYANKNISSIQLSQVNLVAGVDVSYPPEKDPKWGIGCAVLWDLMNGVEIAHVIHRGEIKFPYIPGFLGFRESPILIGTICKLIKISKIPDVILYDGHGFAHSRFFGAATQIGAILNISSAGIAKNLLFGNCDWKLLNRIRGNKTGIKDSEGALLGYACVLTDNCKPVFISRGFKIDLGTAYEVSMSTSKKHRQPIPIALAHQYSKFEVKRLIHGTKESFK